MNPFACSGIYPILDAAWLEAPGIVPEAVARRLGALPIAMVQLRCKGNGRQAHDFFARWLPLLRHHAPGLPILINDRLDLALHLEADGVHVGQEDVPVSACRKWLGDRRIIGLSAHTVTELREAEAWGVDYVGCGPVFATRTKDDTQPVLGVEGLKELVRATRLPVAAIGGITLEHLSAVAGAGAWTAAMISDLWRGDWSSRLGEACEAWGRAATVPLCLELQKNRH
ncbi:MAG: thiamine phosphate synthase [Magnetococcales bacterium]|nr:thiamine phosphate synthase [Magnetococcales bacterium]